MNYKTIFLIIFLFIIFSFTVWMILKTKVSTVVGKIMKFIIATIILSFLIVLTYSSYSKTKNIQNIYEDKKYKVVEGIVEDYSREENKKPEKFRVNNVLFSISSKINMGGFHKTGKLYEGQKVKIYYIDSEYALTRIILRVDIEE